MSTTEAAISNPFWDELRGWPRDSRGDFDSHPDFSHLLDALDRGEARSPWPEDAPERNRRHLTKEYSWAIPSPDSIAFIVDRLDGRPIVEVGAGTGYWLWLLSQHGIDVRGYDSAPPRLGKNPFHCDVVGVDRVPTEEEFAALLAEYHHLTRLNEAVTNLGGPSFPLEKPLADKPMRCWEFTGNQGPEYIEVIQGGPEVLALPENAGRVLLLCWPPYQEEMGLQALLAFGGDSLFYVGEGGGGCTGTDEMHDILATQWELVDECDTHQQWSGIHDYLQYYQRRS